MNPDRLRGQFPVLERVAFLNAGTCGPVPARAGAAAHAEVERQAAGGRGPAHTARRVALQEKQRLAYAALLGCDATDVALTTSTSEGVGRVLVGLELAQGDEILTSDEEHPGLLGPLQAARDLRGASVRQVPFPDLADEVGPRTRLVACSHVSWVTGALAPPALAGLDVPVVLDGAQGIGAVPVDVAQLGCDAYAGSGQKWLCGPEGTGMLYVSPGLREGLAVVSPSYSSFQETASGIDARLHGDARRYDTPSLSVEASAFVLASLAVLAEAGWGEVHARSSRLAAALADELRSRGREVVSRGDSTLVSWRCAQAEAVRDSLAEAGVVIRDLPGRGLLRASVGAWNDERDLDRLLATLGAAEMTRGPPT